MKKRYEVTCVECGHVKRIVEAEEGELVKSDGKCPNCHSTMTLELFEIDEQPEGPRFGKSMCDYCDHAGCRTCTLYDNYVFNGKEDKPLKSAAEACPINSPSHYKGAYPFEVYTARALLLDTFCTEMKPSDLGLLNEELKYRLRAGLKQYDGLTLEESAQRDIAKAMRCREMREDGW